MAGVDRLQQATSKIQISPNKDWIVIGRKRRRLLSESRRLSGGLYDLVCESTEDVEFADLQHCSGLDLPNRVKIQTDLASPDYEYADFLDVIRRGRWMRMYVCCGYPWHRWREPVHLADFFKCYAQRLRETSQVKVTEDGRFEQNEIFLDVWKDFPASAPLADGARRLFGILRAVHIQTVTELAGAHKPLPHAPSIFVCHDSRDKHAIARPIARGLAELKCDVWFDERKLKAGDRLRASIERGLKDCEKCVVILTPRFLKNLGWARAEFDAIFAREIEEQRDIVLPVWAGVTKEQVARYCLALADRVGVQWTLGCDEVVRQLYVAVGVSK